MRVIPPQFGWPRPGLGVVGVVDAVHGTRCSRVVNNTGGVMGRNISAVRFDLGEATL